MHMYYVFVHVWCVWWTKPESCTYLANILSLSFTPNSCVLDIGFSYIAKAGWEPISQPRLASHPWVSCLASWIVELESCVTMSGFIKLWYLFCCSIVPQGQPLAHVLIPSLRASLRVVVNTVLTLDPLSVLWLSAQWTQWSWGEVVLTPRQQSAASHALFPPSFFHQCCRADLSLPAWASEDVWREVWVTVLHHPRQAGPCLASCWPPIPVD